MLDELLKHDNLGNERELEFVLFHSLSPHQKLRLSEFTNFCTSNIFSISRSIKGIVSLLHFLSIIEQEDDIIVLNLKTFNPNTFESSINYFQTTHFYSCLFQKLSKTGGQENLFNEDNLKFSHTQNQFYVKSHLIKLDLFPIRNLLISLKFLQQDQTIPDHLLINTNFTEFFRKTIIKELQEGEHHKRMTLEQLKINLTKKDEAGKQGEFFVLKYEKDRLINHPHFDKIERIAETYANAGYDIKSFNDLDSFIHDRFIEVKSYTKEIEFYWSKNEIERAKQLKSKYYLYLVDRSQIHSDEYIPKIFQNPYKRIFESDIWKKETENWKIALED